MNLDALAQDQFLVEKLKAINAQPAPTTHAGRAAQQEAFRELLRELDKLRGKPAAA